MGYGKAIEEVAKFLRSLIDWLRGRRTQEPEKIPETKDDSSITVHDTLEALKILSKDLQVPRQRKKDGILVLEGDICWAFQVKLKRLRYTDDATEMVEILSDMRKLMSEKVLKRFSSDCPGLPGMINSVCYCCSGLDDNKAEINGLTQDIEKQIRTAAIEVSRSLLLPVAKRRKKRESLHDDTRKAVVASLNLFRSTIAKFSQEWTEDLADQIKRTVEVIPSIIKKKNLMKDDVKTALKDFSQQVPTALSVLAKEHREAWIPTLQSLCGTRPPGSGPLCRLWKRLTIISIYEGFNFIQHLVETTFDVIAKQRENQVEPSETNDTEAEIVTGCLNSLLEQCCKWEPQYLGMHWNNRIRPSIESYKWKRQEEFKEDSGPVRDYLEKMIESINKAFEQYENLKAHREIKDIVAPRVDPSDSLYGLK